MATAFGSAAGGGALLGRVLIVALVVWVVYLAVHRRSIPRRAIACLLAIAAEYTIVGIVRTQLEVDASLYTRYAYLSGILALIAAASLIGRPTIPVARRPLAVAVGRRRPRLLTDLERDAAGRVAASSTPSGRT